jgi:hypothetical protein
MNNFGRTSDEHDCILALKAAVDQYCRHLYSSLFTGGKLREYAPADALTEVRQALIADDVDEFGRDSWGINIDGAELALSSVRGES